MSAFNARDRVKLTEELRTELYDLIHEHGRMVDLTLSEVLGVLENFEDRARCRAHGN